MAESREYDMSTESYDLPSFVDAEENPAKIAQKQLEFKDRVLKELDSSTSSDFLPLNLIAPSSNIPIPDSILFEMASKIIRERIDFLFQKLISSREIRVSADNEVGNETLEELDIRCIHFDPENIHDKNFNMSQNPPILFQAMAPEKLADHPIDKAGYLSEDLTPWLNFRNYDHEAEIYWRVEMQSIEVVRYLHYYAVGMIRKHVRPQAVSLMHMQGLERVTMPNSLLLYSNFCGFYPNMQSGWGARLNVEPSRVNGKRVHPHLTLGVTHSFHGHEGSIIWGEVAAIVDAMSTRSRQQIIPEEEEEEVHKLEADPPSGPRAFDREERFPILVLSFLGGRKARVLYACMDDEQLVIRQSRLYSFQTLADAPFDLFTRLYLSQPLASV